MTAQVTPVVPADAAASISSTRKLGSGATDAMSGNDPRIGGGAGTVYPPTPLGSVMIIQPSDWTDNTRTALQQYAIDSLGQPGTVGISWHSSWQDFQRTITDTETQIANNFAAQFNVIQAAVAAQRGLGQKLPIFFKFAFSNMPDWAQPKNDTSLVHDTSAAAYCSNIACKTTNAPTIPALGGGGVSVTVSTPNGAKDWRTGAGADAATTNHLPLPTVDVYTNNGSGAPTTPGTPRFTFSYTGRTGNTTLTGCVSTDGSSHVLNVGDILEPDPVHRRYNLTVDGVSTPFDVMAMSPKSSAAYDSDVPYCHVAGVQTVYRMLLRGIAAGMDIVDPTGALIPLVSYLGPFMQAGELGIPAVKAGVYGAVAALQYPKAHGIVSSTVTIPIAGGTPVNIVLSATSGYRATAQANGPTIETALAPDSAGVLHAFTYTSKAGNTLSGCVLVAGETTPVAVAAGAVIQQSDVYWDKGDPALADHNPVNGWTNKKHRDTHVAFATEMPTKYSQFAARALIYNFTSDANVVSQDQWDVFNALLQAHPGHRVGDKQENFNTEIGGTTFRAQWFTSSASGYNSITSNVNVSFIILNPHCWEGYNPYCKSATGAVTRINRAPGGINQCDTDDAGNELRATQLTAGGTTVPTSGGVSLPLASVADASAHGGICDIWDGTNWHRCTFTGVSGSSITGVVTTAPGGTFATTNGNAVAFNSDKTTVGASPTAIAVFGGAGVALPVASLSSALDTPNGLPLWVFNQGQWIKCAYTGTSGSTLTGVTAEVAFTPNPGDMVVYGYKFNDIMENYQDKLFFPSVGGLYPTPGGTEADARSYGYPFVIEWWSRDASVVAYNSYPELKVLHERTTQVLSVKGYVFPSTATTVASPVTPPFGPNAARPSAAAAGEKALWVQTDGADPGGSAGNYVIYQVQGGVWHQVTYLPTQTGSVVTRVRTTDSTLVTNSTVLLADDTLTIPLLGGEYWEVTLNLIIVATDITQDVQLKWQCPSGCVIRWGAIGSVGSTVAGFGPTVNTSTPFALLTETGSPVYGTGAVASGLGIRALVHNGGTAGNLTIMYSQGTAVAGQSVQLGALSDLKAVKLA